MHRGPDTSLAARVGEPTLEDPKPTNAPDLMKQNQAAFEAASGKGTTGTSSISVEPVKGGAPAPNQPVPRSEPAPPENAPDSGIPELRPIAPAGTEPAASSSSATPPAQINEAAGDQGNAPKPDSNAAGSTASSATSSASSTAGSSDNKTTSSSKKKKKKGLGKLNPF
jgi:outer membrane protein assembly factor BamD